MHHVCLLVKTICIKTFDANTIKAFYHDWYRPDMQAIIAVGDFDVKEVEELIKNQFRRFKKPCWRKATYHNIPCHQRPVPL
jgi:zinc protease